MLVSTVLLTKAANGAQSSYMQTQEPYKASSDKDKDSKKELPFPVMATLLALATILFIFELIVLFHAIKIAMKCSRPGPERISHLVLAIFFTYPYLLFALFLSDCSKTV
jgi:hypothetical protein